MAVMETNDDFSYAERLILRLLARDLTVREIGSELSLSVKTVRIHVRSIYRKLGVSSRVEAMHAARAGTARAERGSGGGESAV